MLANNLANADTPGFRAERAVFAEFLQPQAAAGEALPGDRGVGLRHRPRDLARHGSRGRSANTGNPLDLALQGDGFFAVETPRGERYTRAGRFALGAATAS